MKIAIGNDHTAVALKNHIVEHLQKQGHEVVNFGTDDPTRSDYPVYGARAARAVASGECDRGIVICGTGIGISITANKIKGIRCALCSEPLSARLTREHNDANMLAMGARMIGTVMAENIVDTFMTTEFTGDRHIRRIEMVAKLENGETIE